MTLSLAVAAGVEGEVAEQFAVFGDGAGVTPTPSWQRYGRSASGYTGCG
ncbi:MAG TPA: hypothetical protein VME70_08030 [Mycobacteriales bacterium]|nr:hypothetical protein [Mycobacteriales bacterium]